MIYLPIKEASKYIKRETGIKFSDYELGDYAARGYLSIFFSNSKLFSNGIWRYYNHEIIDIIASNETAQIKDELAFELCEGRFGLIKGYSEVYVNTGLVWSSNKKPKVSTQFINCKEAALHSVRSLLEFASSHIQQWAKDNLLKKTEKSTIELVRLLEGAIFGRLEVEVLFDSLLSENGKKLALTDLYCEASIENSESNDIIHLPLKEAYISLPEVKHLLTCIKEGKLSPLPTNNQEHSYIGIKKQQGLFGEKTTLSWKKLNDLFPRKGTHVINILDKLEAMSDKNNGIVKMKNIKDLAWKGGLKDETVRSLKETFIPRVEANIDSLTPD